MNSRDSSPTLLRDLLAGTVVFLVALPLCLGIASASGVDPFAGLLSGIIGGLIIALLSGSQLSVSGPAAGLVVIVVEGIARLGSFPAFLLAVLLSGVIQFGFGMLKAGRFAAYVPSSVIKGMLAAIGLMLIIKQVPLAAGFAKGGAAVGGTAAGMLDTPFGAISVAACLVAVVSIAVLAAWETKFIHRFALLRMIPASLVVVVIGIGTMLVLDAMAPAFAPPSEYRVALPSLASMSALSSAFVFPDFSYVMNPAVWRLAVTLAVIASLETLLSLEAVEQIDPKKRFADPDRELKAQGIGNMIGGAIGALPITSTIVRSSANVRAGAQSRWASFVHGVLLLGSVFALTPVLNLIPLASLAAILIFTGLHLARPSLFVEIARQGLVRFVPFVVTIVGVLATDLLIGILLGIAVSIGFAIYANLQRPIAIEQNGNHFLLSFRKDVSFLSKVGLKQRLGKIPDGASVIVDGTYADFIDPDVRELIDNFVRNAPDRGITMECRQLERPRRDQPENPEVVVGVPRMEEKV